MDREHILYRTEEFLERQLGSAAAREAAKRRVKRGVAEVGRRLRRATLVFVLLVGLLIAASIGGISIGFFTWLVALPTILLAALITMTFPTRGGEQRSRAAAGAPERLDLLAAGTEEWLLERCRDLPRPALPAIESILHNLKVMEPCLVDLPPNSPLAGETRRLIGQHLPRLVDSYLALPWDRRVPGSENDLRVAESLDLVAQELSRLCHEVGQDRSLGFEVNRRFIESRYGDER